MCKNMVQTVKSLRLQPGQQGLFLEKPHILSRIFFKITAILPQTVNYLSKISFDDPLFVDYYTLLGSNTYFGAEGDGIFQGNILVFNKSIVNILYSVTEILL